MTEELPQFVVKAVQLAPDEDGELRPLEEAPVRYWTGRAHGSWPEYLKDRDRAHRMDKGAATAAALQFNLRTENFTWSTEPA